jgi:hypothetical protein
LSVDPGFLWQELKDEVEGFDDFESPGGNVSNESEDETYLDDDSPALWDGDHGSLDGKQRDALVM